MVPERVQLFAQSHLEWVVVHQYYKLIEVLGRAKALGDFIKHGESKAIIELELKGKMRNSTIRRVLEREGEGKCTSKWSINGISRD